MIAFAEPPRPRFSHVTLEELAAKFKAHFLDPTELEDIVARAMKELESGFRKQIEEDLYG